MKIELATEKDNEALKTLLTSSTIRGPVEYRIERPGSFFDLYRLQSSNFDTILLRDEAGQIQGTATILFRPAHVGGEVTTVGWATDLRIAPTRKAIQSWTEYFLPTIEAALKKRDAKYLFSVISAVDSTIQNALIRPRAQRRQIPTYHLLRKFDYVTIMGHWPLFYDRLKGLRIQRASDADLGPLSEYLARKATHRNLSFVYSEELLRWRIQHWPGLRIDSFLVAKDRQGQIVGCVAPWSPRSVQKLFPTNYDNYERTVKSALRLGSALNWSVSLPEVGQEIEAEFLTHFYANNPDIFGCLLEEAYRLKGPRSVQVYPHFHRYPLTLPPKQFLYDRTLAGLYVVTLGEEDLPDELQPNQQNLPPEIELGLI